MPDVQLGTEALVAGRQQRLDGVERGRLHHVDHYGRRQHVDQPAAHPGAVCSSPTTILAEPVRPSVKALRSMAHT